MKKIILMLVLILLPINVYAKNLEFSMALNTISQSRLNYDDWCSNTTEGNAGIRSAVRIVGYVIKIAKWVVPMLIIIFGIVDFTKASIASDDKALSKATNFLIKRVIAGIIVFFIPTIIISILNFIGLNESDNFPSCTNCIFYPENCR